MESLVFALDGFGHRVVERTLCAVHPAGECPYSPHTKSYGALLRESRLQRAVVGGEARKTLCTIGKPR